MERGVLLPLHHGLTEDMFLRLHETIDEFLSSIRKCQTVLIKLCSELK